MCGGHPHSSGDKALCAQLGRLPNKSRNSLGEQMEGFSGGGGGVGSKQWLGWGSYAWILFASVEGAKRGKTGRHPFLRPGSQRRIQREVRLEAVNDRARLFVKAHMGESEMFKHFSFHYVGSGDQTQIVRLNSKQASRLDDPLSHLARLEPRSLS